MAQAAAKSLTLSELLSRKAAFQQQAEDLRKSIEPALEEIAIAVRAVDEAIDAMLAVDLSQMRKLQAKEFGAVHFTRDGYRVTQTIPKRVKWDQDQLRAVFDRIQASGDNPFNWMKAEWKVGEKDFLAYPKEIQAVFSPARTVIPGDPKIEFKLIEGDAHD